MKKIISMLVVAVMLLSVLASCATGGSGDNNANTSATNTAVKLKVVVGTDVLYDLDVTVNGDAPVAMDAVKAAIKDANAELTLSEAGDKLASAKEYKDCTLTINDADVSFYWTFKLNDKAKNKPDETPIKADDVIVFEFTRGSLDASDNFVEAPYDPSTNEYYDPDTVTTAAE